MLVVIDMRQEACTGCHQKRVQVSKSFPNAPSCVPETARKKASAILKAREPAMRSAQRVTQRPLLFFLPLLLCQFLIMALSSCGAFQCESVPLPSVIPRIFIAGGRVYLFSEGTGLLVLQESSGKHLWQASGQLEAGDADPSYLSLSPDNTP